ncbi:MAG: methyltransferase [Candidatus Goldiibacteriota bacterium HGW-Goldbacteria-1]|jgi:cystathionine beta-lyase/cystathionine gamma-synthase|nr:MAG: methyltransferase [Candidatus Goldiibacteriota bacterium HGW-Goldbacteria-1]
MAEKIIECRLCGENACFFTSYRHADFYKCSVCGSVMTHENAFMPIDKEKKRYEKHNNDINDSGYRAFTAPVVKAVTGKYSKDSAGLDFGSGSGPVITTVLKEKNYNIETYDIFFDNDLKKLEHKYDYIVCCETAEHFKKPAAEFALLFGLLKPGGAVFLMTEMYEDTLNFSQWHYKNDATHVFFYTRKAFEVIKKKFGFAEVIFDGRLITLLK